jgi:nicotinamidase/pyrazinamidase
MPRALLLIDLQRDFTARAADGDAVAALVNDHIRAARSRYRVIVGSRDWHDPDSDNGGHFPAAPAGHGGGRWIAHCVAGTPGAEYSPLLDTSPIGLHVRKGQGFPGFSIFEGTTDEGEPFPQALRRLGITDVDIAGIATEHCVAAAAADALAAGLGTRILLRLCRALDDDRARARVSELAAAGVEVERG